MKVSVELDDASVKVLDAIKLAQGFTYQESVSKALALFDWALTRYGSGLTLATLNESTKTYREVDMKQFLKSKRVDAGAAA